MMRDTQTGSQKLAPILSQYELYLQEERGLSPTSCRHYLHKVESFLRFCDRHAPALFLPANWELSDLRLKDIQVFLKDFLQARQRKPNTLSIYLIAIRSFFKFLYKKQFIEVNPVRNFTLKISILDLNLPPVTAEEIQKLFVFPIPTTLEGCRNQALIEMVYGLGLTPPQLASLQRIELQSNQIILIWKTHSSEKPLGQKAFNVLQHYQDYRQSQLTQLGLTEAAFWIQITGKKLSGKELTEIIQQQIDRVGIENLSAKQLSALSAKHFVAQGADIRSLQKYRGNKGISHLEQFESKDFQSISERFAKAHLRNQSTD